jgi:photosystem II stability/assembly factor-like uncharacterized protein
MAKTHSKKGKGRKQLTHHKKRAAWFGARIAWPLREARTEKLKQARGAARKIAAGPPVYWEPAGPTDIGGRCTAVLCHPQDPDRVWIGAAGGGVWKSDDAGQSWRPSWPEGAPLQIGSLAMDPGDPDVLYCGTGEANLSGDSFSGDGVYRSTDGGETWQAWATPATARLPRRIGTIAVDPFDSRHVCVGGVGFGRMSPDDEWGGMHTTRDGGMTWHRENFVSANNYWCHCIVFDPVRRGRIYATFTGPGVPSGIYRSVDGGERWIQLTGGLPPSDRMGRTSVCVAASNPGVLYAIAADALSKNAGLVLGVFRSADGGDVWDNVAHGDFDKEEQMRYGNTIAVHPLDANQVLCGGVNLHATTDGGGAWRQASAGNVPRGRRNYAHADHHALAITPKGRVYDANDGGLDVSEDGGRSWSNRSKGLAITMFYDIDVAQSVDEIYGGGAQDNGTVLTEDGDSFRQIEKGDGGWMVIDPNDPGHRYASWQEGGITRFRDKRSRDVSPPFKDEESVDVWMVYITFDPGNPKVVYTGNTRLYRTEDDGLEWGALTPVLDGSPITAIEVAMANPSVIYVGTQNGGFFRSLDRGSTWSANLTSPELPGVIVTRIETHPDDAHDVYITVGNDRNSHVFRSKDAGSNWIDIDAGRLPDSACHALLIPPDRKDELYICSNVGVFVTRDGGGSWENMTGNLPETLFVDLVYQQPTRTLFVATYGRSIWKTRLGG